ncbi:MAG: PmoA family protein [Planctomycetota bacterium]|nr:PmoA family protein [Planctomycetota bacterium]
MRLARRATLVTVAACLCAAIVAALSGTAAWAATRTLVVEAGKVARANVPMSVPVPQGATQAKMTDGAKEVPCQVAEGNLCWILDDLAAGATKAYTVDFGAACSADPKAVRLDATAETVEISIDGKPFTTYHVDNPKIVGVRIKRPYFWPVLGPDQTPMTRPWPCADADPSDKAKKDHPHHTSLWVAYGEVGGVDNWSNTEKAGWQVHKVFSKMQGGPVVGWFRETLDWTDAARKPNLAEVRTARFWRLPQAGRMIDLEIALQARYGKVVFGDTKEGGICSTRMRTEFRADKDGADGRLVLSTGLAGDPAWGKRADWCDSSGLVAGKRYGYAIFDAPGNPAFPTRWHARSYGLVSTNPFAVAAFEKGAPKNEVTLEEGKEMVFRYRLYFHPGDEKAAAVAARYADYADPPVAAYTSGTATAASRRARETPGIR